MNKTTMNVILTLGHSDLVKPPVLHSAAVLFVGQKLLDTCENTVKQHSMLLKSLVNYMDIG